MKTRTPLALALAIALPTTCLAQDYVVSGPNLSGTATITEVGSSEDGQTAVEVSVTYQRFGKKAHDPRTIAGVGTRSGDGRVEWNHVVDVETTRRGAVDWLRDPYLRRPDPEHYTVDLKSVLRQLGNGDLQGMVDGDQQTWRIKPESKGLVVLMVPGLSTNYWNRMGLPYFDENRDTLRAQGLTVRRIGTKADGSVDPNAAFKTENSVEQNAAQIAKEIRAEAAKGNRVILFAHSKGGTDSTAAIALNPDLIPHVAGMVAIQPVYGGSPVANLAASNAVTTAGVKLAFEIWAGGSRDAVLAITSKRRAAFVREHPYPADRIPTVVIRSTFKRSPVNIGRDANGDRVTNVGKRFFQRVLRANQTLIKMHEDLESDGMVDMQAQTIPGATFIDKTNLDHFEPGLTMVSPHTPANLTTEAIGKLFQLIAKRGETSEASRVPGAGSLIPGEGEEAEADAESEAPSTNPIADWWRSLNEWWESDD